MKQYDAWNEVKKKTEQNNRTLGIKQREIFWVKIGQNLGSEEYGKDKDFVRPVVIIRKLTHDLFIGVPLTTTIKDSDYFHSFEYINNTRGSVQNTAMILQIRAMSIKRILSRIGMVNKNDFNEIVRKAQKLINPT